MTSFGGQIMERKKTGEFLVFMDAEDSLEGLVKVATRKKLYKCLAKLVETHYSPECVGLKFTLSKKDCAYF